MHDADRSLFDPLAAFEPGPAADPCAARHGGVETSVAAWGVARQTAESWRETILAFIGQRKDKGATLDEICEHFDVAANRISGRVTSLAQDKLIRKATKDGLPIKRKTRGGVSAFVWVRVSNG